MHNHMKENVIIAEGLNIFLSVESIGNYSSPGSGPSSFVGLIYVANFLNNFFL